ncbi:MAG: HAMP domain-containing protein [Deltaproteobacteria bacterium]|uniref:histidine kinase n=1 Tax=Candidatus Zymogenus saltonus TaxID=2844893 RepID=A0A9D8KFE0_9DELT|nr:HAMP domain-containing protein [Candidatus Zymogenus saltonus]
MDKKRRKVRISLKLFLLFTYVGLIPIIFISFYTYYEINRVVAIEAENRLVEVGTGLSGNITRLINGSYKTMKLLARNPVIADDNKTAEEKGLELKKMESFSPDIMDLFILSGGEVTARGGIHGFPADRVEAKALLRDSPRITGPFVSSKLSTPAFIVSVPILPPVPVSERGERETSVLVGVFNLEGLWDVTNLTRIGKTGRAVVIDSEGRRIAGVGTDMMFTKFTDENINRITTVGKGIVHYTDDNAVKYIVFGTLVSGLKDIGPEGLRVVVFLEEDEAFLIADKIRKGLPYAVIVILIATSIVSFILSDAISRPIKKLTRATELIAKGEFSEEIVPTSSDEIGVLTDSFNRMARELSDSRDFIESYNKELERLVRERSRKLKESEEKYRMVVEGSGDGWVVFDKDGEIKFANRSMGSLVGKEPVELLGRKLDEFISLAPKGVDAKGAIHGKVLEDDSGKPIKIEMVGIDGDRKYLEVAIFSLSGEESEGRGEHKEGTPLFLAHLKDVTDIHTLETESENLKLELMERAKHSQIGVLAEGLFHNLNNPLQALVSLLKVNSEDLESELTQKGKKEIVDLSEWRQNLISDSREAYNLSKKLSDQVRNLMAKVRNEGKREVEELDINQILAEEIKFLEADLFFKHKIVKELILDEKIPPFRGVHSDFSQSFVNIILNAVDGMREAEERKLTVKTAVGRDDIVVTFQDTGVGIDERDIPNIFKPFFTTKRDQIGRGDSGTGLGLFTVDFLLKPYGAAYNVKSKPGETSFEIRLPISKGRNKKGVKKRELKGV